MCFKKKPTEMVPIEWRVLTFGKNKPYSGGQNLSGCVNDSNNLIKRVKSDWAGVDFRQYLDSLVVADTYLSQSEKAISLLDPGATVLVMSDSCFSQSVTRLIMSEKDPTKSKFFNPGLISNHIIKSNPLRAKDNMKWIAMSACSEHESAADAYFKNPEGAYSHYAWQVLRKGMTYREWHNEILAFLPSDDYPQRPTQEGPDYLLDRKVFEGQTLWIQNSSHGSWTYDLNGDEVDGRDEGLYFDRLLLDDEIGIVLDKIP